MTPNTQSVCVCPGKKHPGRIYCLICLLPYEPVADPVSTGEPKPEIDICAELRKGLAAARPSEPSAPTKERQVCGMSVDDTFGCAASKAGTAGGNYPQDCDWPFCGCDPKVEKVISTLLECGWNPPPLFAAPAQPGPKLPENVRELLERFRELDAVRLSPSAAEQEEMDETLAELLDAPAPAQGTPEPPKVEELQAIAEKWAVDTDREIDPHAFAEFAKFVLRRYFPPASQTPPLENVLDVIGGLIATYETGDHADNPCGDCVICTAEKILEELATPASTARTDGRVWTESGKLPDQRVWVNACVEHDGNRHVVPCYGVILANDNNRWRWESEFPVIAWQPLPAAPGSVPPLCNDPDCGDCYDKREALEHAQKGVPQAEPPKEGR